MGVKKSVECEKSNRYLNYTLYKIARLGRKDRRKGTAYAIRIAKSFKILRIAAIHQLFGTKA